jgi:hypothetical protein
VNALAQVIDMDTTGATQILSGYFAASADIRELGKLAIELSKAPIHSAIARFYAGHVMPKMKISEFKLA